MNNKINQLASFITSGYAFFSFVISVLVLNVFIYHYTHSARFLNQRVHVVQKLDGHVLYDRWMTVAQYQALQPMLEHSNDASYSFGTNVFYQHLN